MAQESDSVSQDATVHRSCSVFSRSLFFYRVGLQLDKHAVVHGALGQKSLSDTNLTSSTEQTSTVSVRRNMRVFTLVYLPSMRL